MLPLTTRQYSGLWVLAAILAQVTLSVVVSAEDLDILHQRAQYYVKKLGETLDEIDTHSPRIQKRCASIPGFCEDLVEVTQKACPNYEISSKGTTTATPVAVTQQINVGGNTEDKPETDSTDLQRHDNGTVPLCPFLTNTTAKRIEQNKIEVDLFVNHSTAVTVEIFLSFDSQKTILDAPDKLETETGDVTFKTSRVSLTFDSSTCHPGFGGVETKIYLIPVQNSNCIVEVDIEICRLNDEIMNTGQFASVNGTEDEELSHGEPILDGKKISQVFPLPRITFSPDQVDTMLIEKGKNVSIEFEVTFDWKVGLQVYCHLWNWTSNKKVVYGVEMEMKGSKIDIDEWNWNDENTGLLSVDVLDKTIVNTNKDVDGGDDGDDGDDDDYNYHDDEHREIVARMRITVNVASGELSGKLGISYSRYEEKRSRKRICDKVQNQMYIALKFPNKMSPLPLNTIGMQARSVKCNEHGNLDGLMSGNHCILRCYVWGSDIKSVSITKSSQPGRPPVKSASFSVYDITASTMQDVGPASEDNDGDYTCTVTFHNGQIKSEEFSLTTMLFTKITNFTLEHLDNSTSRLVCTAVGPGDLDIRIVAVKWEPSYTEESLGDAMGAWSFIETFSSKTVLTVLIPNDDFPFETSEEVACLASGDDGGDEMSMSKFDNNNENVLEEKSKY